MQVLLIVLGRVCLSVIFILSGISKIMDIQTAEAQLVDKLSQFLTTVHRIEWLEVIIDQALAHAQTLIITTIVLELLGGILVLLGVKVRFGAFLLMLFLIPATIVMHRFWDLQGDERQIQMIMFLKNLAIFGGLLLVFAYGSNHLRYQSNLSSD